MRLRGLIALCACLTLLSASVAVDPAPDVDAKTLESADLAGDSASLLAFVRRRTVTADDEKRARVLIVDLGDEDFNVRQLASERLAALGVKARPYLREALSSRDAEVAHRSRQLLEGLQNSGDPSQGSAALAAAARRLVRQRAEGAGEALLTWLVRPDDEAVAEEIRQALPALAVRDGKADPLFVASLTDKAAGRRSAAGTALVGAPDERPAVRRLLRDPDAVVRLRVGLALAQARDRNAIPVLIALLNEPGIPLSDFGEIEDLLYRLADDKSPLIPPGDDAEGRQRVRTGWEAWWKEQGARVELARLDEVPRSLGYTLVVSLDQGKVMELDAANKPRWTISDLQFPLDAQRLPGDRLLTAEHGGNRVAERNTRGDILWEYKVDNPLIAQRLANGNTVIGTREQLVEVDRAGKVSVLYSCQDGDTVMRGQKLPKGDLAIILQNQNNFGIARYLRIDKSGKQVASFFVDITTSGGRIDVLPNGHILIPEMFNNRVVEYSGQGQQVAMMHVLRPIAATRLANGHTLVTSMVPEIGAVEIDKDGDRVWGYSEETRVTRAYRR